MNHFFHTGEIPPGDDDTKAGARGCDKKKNEEARGMFSYRNERPSFDAFEVFQTTFQKKFQKKTVFA